MTLFYQNTAVTITSLPTMTQTHYDLCIVGSGLAGMSLALRAAHTGLSVCIICKTQMSQSASHYAQGGIAAVLDETDALENHIHDTLRAGSGLCDESIVQLVVEKGPENIRWLTEKGAQFSYQDDNKSHNLHLTQEGGHSHRRVVHAADATGWEVSNALGKHLRAYPNIHLVEFCFAVDLTLKTHDGRQRATGLQVLDVRSNQLRHIGARFVVLASGGFSHAWLYNSNPDICSGDGIAMALRAGCSVCNMELMQFHPTCLYHRRDRCFLISEALRGEGGRLLLPSGEAFMHHYDARAELAPRDIVARAIDAELKKHGIHYVLLDISHKPCAWIQKTFPTIYRRCGQNGLDICHQGIPVVPAAHYCCGGIQTDSHAQTNIDGLFAIGECAHTGLHGANRLASNSLLECLVFAQNAHLRIMQLSDQYPTWPLEHDALKPNRGAAADHVVIEQNWHELRRTMWNYVGILRKTSRMEMAEKRLRLILSETEELIQHAQLSSDLLELRNLSIVALACVRSALQRQESRGLHYNVDYPTMSAQALNTVLTMPAHNRCSTQP